MAGNPKSEAGDHLFTEELGAYAKETMTKLAAFPKEWEKTGGDIIKLKEPEDPSALVALIAELRSLHKSASQIFSCQMQFGHTNRSADRE